MSDVGKKSCAMLWEILPMIDMHLGFHCLSLQLTVGERCEDELNDGLQGMRGLGPEQVHMDIGLAKIEA